MVTPARPYETVFVALVILTPLIEYSASLATSDSVMPRSDASVESLVTAIVFAAPVTWPESTSLLLTTEAYTCEVEFALILLAMVASVSPEEIETLATAPEPTWMWSTSSPFAAARVVPWVTWSADASRWTPIWKPPAAAPPVSTALTAVGLEDVTVCVLAHTDGARIAWAAVCSDCIDVWIAFSAAWRAVSTVLCWVSSVSGWRSIASSWSMIEFVSRPVAMPPTLKNGVALVDFVVVELEAGVLMQSRLLVDQQAAAGQRVEHAPRRDLLDDLAVPVQHLHAHLPRVVIDVEVQVHLACGQLGDHLLRRRQLGLHLGRRRSRRRPGAEEPRRCPRARSQGDHSTADRIWSVFHHVGLPRSIHGRGF